MGGELFEEQLMDDGDSAAEDSRDDRAMKRSHGIWQFGS